MNSQSPQMSLNELLKIYLDNLNEEGSSKTNLELEVRFGRKKPISRIEFNNAIQHLISSDFVAAPPENLLRITNEQIDLETGRTKISNSVRTEISGLQNIIQYCKTNRLPETMNKTIQFVNKERFRYEGEFIKPIDFNDLNFRVDCKVENPYLQSSPVLQNLLQKWSDNKKIFRFLNRTTFIHEKFPFKIDFSIVKSSKQNNRNFMIPEFTFEDSGVLKSSEKFEIEIEIDNEKIGKNSTFNDKTVLEASLRRVIKMILCGVQNSKYPIPYSEQLNVRESYMRLIWGEQFEEQMLRRISPRNFMGPSVMTLQMKNVAAKSEDSQIPNIRTNYVVTEKTDGDRMLLYINNEGKIYLIDTNMNVMFTGSITENNDVKNSLFDGEYIRYNKEKRFIDKFAVFDAYFIDGNDIRSRLFTNAVQSEREGTRFQLLAQSISQLKHKSVTKSKSKIHIKEKQFIMDTKSIFSACNQIMSKIEKGLFEYNTDGLIFTPTDLGVGGQKPGQIQTKPMKTSWEHSLKWKPAHDNTVDFLVSIQKDKTGKDFKGNLFNSGTDVTRESSIKQYKTLVLMVGYDPNKHGYVNPCENIIQDDLPDYKGGYGNDYRPAQFFPTNPEDKKAGLTNILISQSINGEEVLLTANNEVIEDNMIVEFRYEMNNKEQWRWVPRNVRYDKTQDFRNGGRNYGNAWHVANSNWNTIYNPITDEMIRTGNIPDNSSINDEYYNQQKNETNSKGLRHFHNRYIKNKLIRSASRPNNTLIDLAVGKAGDLQKWTDAKLKFVLGIDVSRDNLHNNRDGACSRYLTQLRRESNVPRALFVAGDSRKNILDGTALLSEKDLQIANAVFGVGPKDEKLLGKGVYKNYGVGRGGFDVTSIQFAIHYMFENTSSLLNFLQNVAEVTKKDGILIGTSFNGNKIFNLLKDKQVNDSIEFQNEDKTATILKITKLYDNEQFNADYSSIGYPINVYQESINNTFKEYLVNYDLLSRLLENYGFAPIRRAGLNSVGSFKELFEKMKRECKENSELNKMYKTSLEMTSSERTISNLNNYFMFQKVRDVDAKQVTKSLLQQGDIKTEQIEIQRELMIESLKQPSTLSPKVTIKQKRKTKLKLRE